MLLVEGDDVTTTEEDCVGTESTLRRTRET